MNLEMKRRIFDAIAWAAGLVVAALLVTDAMAESRQTPSATNATWQTECGSCRAARPSQLPQ